MVSRGRGLGRIIYSPERDHEGIGGQEDREPEPEEGVELLVDHVKGQNAEAAEGAHGAGGPSSGNQDRVWIVMLAIQPLQNYIGQCKEVPYIL